MDFIFLETDDFHEASNDLSSLKKKKKKDKLVRRILPALKQKSEDV